MADVVCPQLHDFPVLHAGKRTASLATLHQALPKLFISK